MKEICIVTGGAGFIGSHLCEVLLNKEFQVVCVDNLISGRIQNISSFKNSPNFVFFNIDLVKPFPKEFTDLLKKASYIFHLASPASPNKKSPISYYALPVETLLVNSYGTYKLLESIRSSKAKFLFASTSEVYGDPKEHPQNEKYWGNVNPVGERSCYDEAKRFGEAISFTYLRKHASDVRIVRIFNTYGPRMHKDDGRAVVEFINLAIKNNRLPIFGDGKQTRSFCYVSDLVEGIYRAMFFNNTKGEVINLGNPNEITIMELAQNIKKIIGSKSQLSYEELPSDDPKRRKPDISKANELLKWFPQISLSVGLVKTIDYFKNN